MLKEGNYCIQLPIIKKYRFAELTKHNLLFEPLTDSVTISNAKELIKYKLKVNIYFKIYLFNCNY